MLHGPRSGSVVIQEYNQGYGISETEAVRQSAVYFDTEAVKETPETHVIPRESLTKQQHLTLFGKKSLLKTSTNFGFNDKQLKRKTSVSKRLQRPDMDFVTIQQNNRKSSGWQHGPVKQVVKHGEKQ